MENKSITKRKRSVNWDSVEKNLLRSCVKEYISVIENKNTDTNTNKTKNACWLKIIQRFNELNSQERTLNEIKQQWRCAKLEAKRNLSNYKKQLGGTGGGPKPPSPDPVTQEIVDMIPLEFEVDSNIFDSDGIISKKLDATVQLSDSIIIENIEVQTIPQSSASPLLSTSQPYSSTPLVPQPSASPLLSTSQPYSSTPLVKHVTTDTAKLKRTKRKLPLEGDETVKKRNITLAECVQNEHNCKMLQMAERHNWEKEEHLLRMKEINLRIKNLELENLLIMQKLNKSTE